MAETLDFYYSATHAEALHNLNQAGGERLLKIMNGGIYLTLLFAKARAFQGYFFTVSVPIGIPPSPIYSDWVYVGTGTESEIQDFGDWF